MIRERELTKQEIKRREEIAKDLPDAEFKKRYGADWKSVKIATATKIAKKEMKEAIGPKDASDKGEYDYEGQMAIQDLETIVDAADDIMSMLEDDTNLPEWVQAKITKATDYIDSVRDYLESLDDEDEEEDEKPRMETIQALRRRAKDLLEANYSDRSKVKDFSKEKNPVEIIVKTLTQDNAVKSFLNKRPRFDRALYMDGEDLVLGDSFVMTIKDNTTIADIKKAILKVK